MPGTRYDRLDMHRHVAEGKADEVLRRQAAYDTPPGSPPAFYRMIILEVISDPTTLDKAKLSHYEHDLKVSNVRYAAVAPRNSVVARRVMGQDAGASEKVMVLYPFFPPHLAFPAKVGEHVWAMFENPDAKSNDLGYWFCRIVQPSFVEDVNYTHADRQFDPSFVPGLSDVFTGNDNAVYEFPNGATDAENGNRYQVSQTATMPDDPAAYEKLLTTTDASKVTRYEAVPRYRKRPADTAFEGSNNTLIVLGTDRTGPVADYDQDPNDGAVPKPHPADLFADGTGAIDIVVGRGQTPTTAGNAVTNKLGNKELGKSKKDAAPQEGDVDLKTDRTRVLLSQKTKPDGNFGIDGVVSSHASAQAPSDGSGEGAIVVKTDKVRLIARHDVVIMVLGATETDGNGNVKDPTPDASKCASVILRANGDIVFTPSSKGVIKLGSDSANLAVLCAKAVTGAGDGSGNVTAQPITDSMGGSEGAGDANGVFATKVLLS